MKIIRFLSLLLAAILMMSLCGCGTTTVEAYTETDGGGVIAVTNNADTTATVTEVAETTETEKTVSLDFAAAFAKHDPEDIVFTVDGTGVTWQELFYEVVYYSSYISMAEDRAITDWNEACSLFQDAEGKYYTYGTAVLQNAVTYLKQYHIMYDHLTAAGVEYSDASRAEVEALRQSTIDDSFDGDEQAFIDYLESMYCTEDLWMWFNQVDAMYAMDGFNTLYGEFGSKLSDAEVMDYAAGDEDGAWTEYVQLRLIWLYEDEDGETSSEPVTAEEILKALDAAGDKEKAFEEQYALYNEEPAMDHFPGGWCVYRGDTEDAIYEAALELEDGAYTAVEVDGGQVVVMRVPIDPDGGVYFDESTETLYTLRYYAAWQAYSELINGEGGWIDSAEAGWAEGFEDFTLNDVF